MTTNHALDIDSERLLAWKDEELDPELKAYFEDAGGKTGFPMIRHPLVYDVPYSGIPGLLNRRLEAKKDAIAKARKEGNAHQYVWLHERAWRLNALVGLLLGSDATANIAEAMRWNLVKTIWQHRPSTRRLFLDVWSDSENTDSNAELWSHLFSPQHPRRKPGEVLTDNNDAREMLALLPKQFTIYRGISAEVVHEDDPGRIRSWTLDAERARFFADRWAGRGVSGNSGHVISKQVSREDIIALIAGRGEMEVLVQS